MNQELNYFQTRPKVTPIDAQPYLDRLQLKKEAVSLPYLRKLHRAHLLHIPFENLDIHYRRKIVLDIGLIYKKVIGEKRGGLCYELNGLFYHLLARLGFEVFLGSASVFDEDSLSEEFDHMIIFVRVEDKTYLCDVGFGSSFTEPRQLTTNVSQLDYTKYYKFETTPDDEWVLKSSDDNSDFKSVYQFLIKPRQLIEFLHRCNYHQESENSKFTRQKLITQLFPEGRVTLTDKKLRVNLYGEVKEKDILNEDEFLAQLQERFGINTRRLLRQQFH